MRPISPGKQSPVFIASWSSLTPCQILYSSIFIFMIELSFFYVDYFSWVSAQRLTKGFPSFCSNIMSYWVLRAFISHQSCSQLIPSRSGFLPNNSTFSRTFSIFCNSAGPIWFSNPHFANYMLEKSCLVSSSLCTWWWLGTRFGFLMIVPFFIGILMGLDVLEELLRLESPGELGCYS